MVDSTSSTDDLLREQVAYYRARAPVYDDWWERGGTYDRGEAFAAAWDAERQAFERAVTAWLDAERPRRVLEVAGGTGNLTRMIAPHVESMTVLDSSPEVLAINHDKLGTLADRVRYEVADVFGWQPDQPYDGVAMGFWVSHVPAERWDAFWRTVRSAVRPEGSVWIGDNAHPALSWEAGWVEPPEDLDDLRGDGTIHLRTGTHERSLPDGSTYEIVKRFHSPAELVADLARVGFDANAATTDWAFLTGVARPVEGLPRS